MLSGIPEVVEADCSLVSMPRPSRLDRECRCTGKEHQVIVMADMGTCERASGLMISRRLCAPFFKASRVLQGCRVNFAFPAAYCRQEEAVELT